MWSGSDVMENKLKRALVIGASSGIGREMALWLSRNGWMVAAVARREALLQELCSVNPERLLPHCFDINMSSTVLDRMNDVTAAMGGLDLLVISAGIGFLNPELDISFERETVKTNVESFSVIADWGYSYFKTRGCGQIAAITSVGGLMAEETAPAYSASKAYQINYLEALAKRAKKERSGVIVTEIRPGSVNTAMMKGEGHFWIAQPDVVAELSCKAILKKKRLQYVLPRWRFIGFLLRISTLFS